MPIMQSRLADHVSPPTRSEVAAFAITNASQYYALRTAVTGFPPNNTPDESFWYGRYVTMETDADVFILFHDDTVDIDITAAPNGANAINLPIKMVAGVPKNFLMPSKTSSISYLIWKAAVSGGILRMWTSSPKGF